MRINLDILQQLRAMLASYLGHFSHAHSQTTIARLWAEFPWLHALFDVDEGQLKLNPLYENIVLPYYRLQCDFFRAVFPNAVAVIQRGRENEMFNPGGVSRYQTANSPLAQQGQVYRANVRKVVIKESGLSQHGIKRRVLSEIYFN